MANPEPDLVFLAAVCLVCAIGLLILGLPAAAAVMAAIAFVVFMADRFFG